MPNNAPLRIVSIGGGTGLSVLLQGLKRYTRASPAISGGAPGETSGVDITAIVTVTDDGGSSGRLRRDFDVLPPGDIRNCMVALSEDAGLLSRLFQYRFRGGHGLKGHSFGNLFLTALTQIMGDFPDAVRVSSEVLNIAGRIYPSTTANVALEALLEDGSRVVGETRISRSRRHIRQIRLIPNRARPLEATLRAISTADLITLGPGSLFTSVVPNLLVQGIPAAIRKSRALKAYFVNLMWQPGETMHFRASDHVRAIERHSRGRLVDCAVINLRPIRPEVRRRYEREQAMPVENDIDRLAKMGLRVVAGNLLQDSQKVRHDPDLIAAIAMRLAGEARERAGRPR